MVPVHRKAYGVRPLTCLVSRTSLSSHPITHVKSRQEVKKKGEEDKEEVERRRKFEMRAEKAEGENEVKRRKKAEEESEEKSRNKEEDEENEELADEEEG